MVEFCQNIGSCFLAALQLQSPPPMYSVGHEVAPTLVSGMLVSETLSDENPKISHERYRTEVFERPH